MVPPPWTPVTSYTPHPCPLLFPASSFPRTPRWKVELEDPWIDLHELVSQIGMSSPTHGCTLSLGSKEKNSGPRRRRRHKQPHPPWPLVNIDFSHVKYHCFQTIQLFLVPVVLAPTRPQDGRNGDILSMAKHYTEIYKAQQLY